MVKRIGEYFLEAGKITSVQLREALDVHKNKKMFLGETLVSEGMIEELDLLTYLSERFKVQFITSEKLEKMAITTNVSEIIPEKIAEQKNIFPIKYSFNDSKLTLLTHAPQDLNMLDSLKIILDNVKTIVPIVAYSKAIKALIYKQYRGDLQSFERLMGKGVDLKLMAPARESFLDKDVLKQNDTPELSNSIKMIENTKMSFTQIINQGEILTTNRTDTITTNLINKNLAQNDEFLEILRIFSSLFDVHRDKSFQGHTQRVSTIGQSLCKALGMTDVEVNDTLIALFLHDIGKKTHITAFDLKNRADAARFNKYAFIGPKLFSTVNLPKNSELCLSNMYETYNGEGFPGGLKGEKIPLGAQILLLADTYDYLVGVSNIPSPTAYHRIKALGFFSSKLLKALMELENITIVPTTDQAMLKGVIITPNRNLQEELAEKFSRLNIQTFGAVQIESAALILKEHREAITFVLCDADLPPSKITPFNLYTAIKKKEIFGNIDFFLFSINKINPYIVEAAKPFNINCIDDFNPDLYVPAIVDTIKNKS